MHGERNDVERINQPTYLLPLLMEEGEVWYRIGNCLKDQRDREVVEQSELRRKWRLCT